MLKYVGNFTVQNMFPKYALNTGTKGKMSRI